MRTKCIRPVMFVCLFVMSLSGYSAEMPEYTRADYPIHDVARFIYTGSENDDSRPDVIAIDKSGAINVLLAGPNAVLGTAIVTETGVKEPIATVADDFNNDGLTDICINDTLFIATGDGGFAVPRPLGIERLQTLASTDMNGDGKKDLIAIAIIYTSPGMRSAELRTYLGNGDGTFGEPEKLRIVFNSWEINLIPGYGEVIDEYGKYWICHVGDLTGDNIPDLLVTHVFSPDPVNLSRNWIFIGNTAGGFNREGICSTGAGYTYAISVRDFNGDGFLDIFQNEVFYIGNNRGEFLFLYLFKVIDYSPVCSITDVNGDGFPDLAYIHRINDSSGAHFRLGVMPGSETVAFPESHEFPLELPENYPDIDSNYGKIVACSLNGDGCADFIIPDKNPYARDYFISVILSDAGTVPVTEKDDISFPVLSQNTPNPFNSSTTIPYSIRIPGIYELAVYDVLGRKIATLCRGFQGKGEHRAVWNGKTENGSDAASGFYFSVVQQGQKGIVASKRLLLMR